MKKIYLYCVLFIAFALKAQPPGWVYNQQINVSNPNSVNAVDYQLKLTINTQSLISAGRLNSDGSDLRFAGTCTSSAFFNYWIEGGLNTATTAVWVKIPLVAANSSTIIYMFFGNPTATAASAIPGTFRGPNSATDSVSGGTSGGLLVCQRGFRFAPNQNILVTHFGKNEPSGTTRYVTLFNYTSQAILSQTQVAGPSATYSYGPISSPLWLTQGTQYVLQMYGTSSDGYYYQTSSQIGQHLTYFDMQYSNGGTQNTFPTNVLSNYHYGYGDFLYFVCNTLAITPTYTISGGNISITGPTTPLCSGVTITLTTNASGTYSWNTGSTASLIVVSPTTTTNYSVTQVVAGCNLNALVTLTVNSAAPSLSITQSAFTICPTNTVSLLASGGITYTWSSGAANGGTVAPLSTSVYTVTGANGCGSSNATATIIVSQLPVSVLVTPTLICAGDAASLTAVGAVNYTWLPTNQTGATPVTTATATTIYTVIGTTSVCAGTNTVQLSVNPIPTVVTSGLTYSVCEGKSLTLTASGGNNYTWTPGNISGSSIVVTPTSNTSYVVIADNNFGCTSTANQIVIVQPAPQFAMISNKTNICLGTSVVLSATGNNSYTWQPGNLTGSTQTVLPSASTVYSLTGQNTITTCDITKTLSISVFTLPLTVSANTAVCVGGSVTISASGANSYSWTNGPQSQFYLVNPASTTVYSVSAISPSAGINCPVSNTVMVTVNALPTVSASATRTQICKNEIGTLTASGAQTYTWSNLQTNPTFTVKATAVQYTYAVTGTDANGCSNTATVQLKVSNCIGIEELVNSGKLAVYPNPAKTEVFVAYSQDTELSLINELGQVLSKQKHQAGTTSRFELGQLPKGVYFIRIEGKTNQEIEKIIIE